MRRSTLALSCAAVALGAALCAAPSIQLVWEFDTPGNLQGWQPNGHLRDVRVEGGMLRAVVTDWDPILVRELDPPIPATPTQTVEVRIEAPARGAGELFWTGTTAGTYGGFEQEKATPIAIEPGVHVYRLRPFWHAEKQIVKLRLDLPAKAAADAAYGVDYIRILEAAAPAAPAPASFSFDAGLEHWSLEGEGTLAAKAGALTAELAAGARLAAPAIAADALAEPFVSFCMTTASRGMGKLVWATDAANGIGQLDFALVPDGAPHVYNLSAGANGRWRGKIIYMALEPAQGAPSAVALDWIKTTSEPAGEPEPWVERFFVTDALPRAGNVCTAVARIANRGGGVVRGARLALALPGGVRLADGETAEKEIPAVDFYDQVSVAWRIRCADAGERRLELRHAPSGGRAAEAVERFLPALSLPKAAYVPEPKPVRGPYEVGVYYFPGWNTYDRWRPLEPFPERTPVLGRYREGDPEVADWHIKFAVEHGITFFCYDWYWNKGDTSLAHGLHDGYFKAKYKHLLKFCLLWANHDPTVHSPEDNAAVCRYWIDNYFSRPEHFKVGTRPLLVIFSPWQMKRDLGIEGSRAAIELWHRMTREAGVGEVLVAGCTIPGAPLADLKAMGFDAASGYNWPTCGVEGRNYVPYAEVAIGQYERWWQAMARQNALPVIVPASPGWDSRPWGGAAAFVQTERAPAPFAEHLTLAKRFVDETSSPKVVLIEAWNEWGEGSYCEPHKAYGFGHIDAIRATFCPDAPAHVDYGPADVGLGPYDIAPPPPDVTSWEFKEKGDTRGWSPMMGVADFEASGVALRFRTTSGDPAITRGVRVRARDFVRCEVRLALHGGTGEPGVLQLFWTTTLAGTSESASVRVPLVAGDEARTYRLDLASNPLWRGVITQLRLDPGSAKDLTVAIESIQLVPAPPEPEPLPRTSQTQQ